MFSQATRPWFCFNPWKEISDKNLFDLNLVWDSFRFLFFMFLIFILHDLHTSFLCPNINVFIQNYNLISFHFLSYYFFCLNVSIRHSHTNTKIFILFSRKCVFLQMFTNIFKQKLNCIRGTFTDWKGMMFMVRGDFTRKRNEKNIFKYWICRTRNQPRTVFIR